MARVRALFAAVSVVVVAGLVVAASRPHRPAHFAGTITAEMPECPHNWDSIQVRRMVPEKHSFSIETFVYPAGFSVPRAITNVPEFHDCQRIIVDLDERRYGPLMAVFASESLPYVSFERESPRRPVQPLAEVFNHSTDFAYGPLGIRPLFNCLYVYGSAGSLKAKMVPVGNDEERCGLAANPDTLPGTALRVVETQRSRYSLNTFPPVARWDWDPRNEEHYIGLRCGAAWCEIGRDSGRAGPAFSVSAHYISHPGGTLTGEDRVRAIKGWYDEQFLAIDEGAGPGPIARPTRLVGRYFPHPDLPSDAYNDLATFKNRWVPVGYVALSGPSDAAARRRFAPVGSVMHEAVGLYKTKFNLDLVPDGAALDDMNKVSMCWGTRMRCGIPAPDATLVQSCGEFKLIAGFVMPMRWVRTESKVSRPMYRCITYRHHPEIDPRPGTSRWRWLAKDETKWQWCPEGCCEVEVGGGIS